MNRDKGTLPSAYPPLIVNAKAKSKDLTQMPRSKEMKTKDVTKKKAKIKESENKKPTTG